jgi:hypothetical protein
MKIHTKRKKINKDAESIIQRENMKIMVRQKEYFSVEITAHNKEMKVPHGKNSNLLRK